MAQFRRDVKLAWKRGNDMTKLREAIMPLAAGDPLPARYKDHPLGGHWPHRRDCHIESDWLLIDKIVGDDLYPVRTRTHSDLFRVPQRRCGRDERWCEFLVCLRARLADRA